MEGKELKLAFIERLRAMIAASSDQLKELDAIDSRITEYIHHVAANCEGENDVHNVDEVAGACKFLRMCHAYKLDVQHIKRLIRLAELVEWDTKEGHPQKIRLTPLQVYIIAGTVGFLVDKEVENYGKTYIEERKMVQEAIWFVPRKSAKTALDALVMIDDLLYGDVDAECHVVSNSLDQSLIAYTAMKKLLQRMPGASKALKINQKETRWRDGEKRSAAVYCHTAGASTKDGAKASVVIADEYGSAKYVKDRCDMSNAIHVYTSSMGTRKNHLWITSTTAGRVINGPFETYMRNAQEALYRELNYGYNDCGDADWQFLMALHPDSWEYNDESYGLPRMCRKVNPHIGITVQSTYYAEEWQKALSDPEYYKEVVTKLYNQFVSDSARPWIEADQIRHLQVPLKLCDLNPREWMAFCAGDFARTDDLCSLAFVCYNPTKQVYFWDVRAWIAEKNLVGHPNSALYREWAKEGWLIVCPGDIIADNVILDAMDEMWPFVTFAQFGYDAFDSGRFMTIVYDWMRSKRRQQGWSVKQIEAYIKWAFKPIAQTFGNYNAVCSQVKDYVLWPEQKVYISQNPIIPYAFGNAVLMESNDSYQNTKPVKRTANAKVDPCQCICSGYIMLNSYTPFK